MPPPRPRLKVPYPFVLEALSALNPEVHRMFSGFAVYASDRLLLMLRDNVKTPQDNGVWLVLSETTQATEDSLRQEFPSIRRIETLRNRIHHWLLLPSDGASFEQEALAACSLLLRRDPRFGRIPQSRR
jgi:hypothetical protein